MDPVHTEYEFREETTVKNSNNNQPRLSRPARFEVDERTDIPQTDTYVREEVIVEPSPRDVQRQGQPQQFTETYVSEASAPRWEEISRTSLPSSLFPETSINEKEVFGKHYWEQQQEHVNGISSARGEISPRVRRPIGKYVRDLVMWQNTKDSGVIFAAGLFLLFSLSYFSIISVLAYLSLAILLLSASFVFIRQFMQTLQQKQGVHPFQPILNRDVVIPREYAHQQLDNILVPINRALVNLRDLYLADSLAQTLKLAFFMYIMTYIGSWFNLMTLATLIWVMAFTVPKFYVAYRTEIDGVLNGVRSQLREIKERISGMFNQQRNKVAERRRVNSRGAKATETKVTSVRYEEKREKVN